MALFFLGWVRYGFLPYLRRAYLKRTWLVEVSPRKEYGRCYKRLELGQVLKVRPLLDQALSVYYYCLMETKSLLLRFFSCVCVASLCLHLASCDPALSLIVNNRTKSPAYFSMTDKSPIRSDSSFTRTLAPKGNRKKSQAFIYYGIGAWGDVSLSKISGETKRLEVISINDTIILTDSTQMRKFFEERRKGLFKSRIVIDIRLTCKYPISSHKSALLGGAAPLFPPR